MNQPESKFEELVLHEAEVSKKTRVVFLETAREIRRKVKGMRLIRSLQQGGKP